MDEFYNKHYITVDKGRIINVFSDAFRLPESGDICANEYGGWQFKLYPIGEGEPPLTDSNDCHLYRYENGQVRKAAAEELAAELAEINQLPFDIVQANKLLEISQSCNSIIINGCDVTLSNGIKGHISLTAEDQINLNGAKEAINSGLTQYPYHLDGQLCEMYSAEDINIMANSAVYHKLYHTTLCNHYNIWIKRCETVEELQSITYGCDLPFDLAEHMRGLLSNEA